MACTCQPCTLDKDAVLAAVRDLFAAKLREAFDGKRIPCSGSDGWWTGLWDQYNARWSGNRHELHGKETTMSCDGQTITVIIGYTVEDKGNWDEYHSNT